MNDLPKHPDGWHVVMGPLEYVKGVSLDDCEMWLYGTCQWSPRPLGESPFIYAIRPGSELARLNGLENAPDYEKFGRAMYSKIRMVEGFFDMELSEAICQIGSECGLCERVIYDPEKHGDIDEAEPGDPVWIWKEGV